jgi:Negative regulator of sigma F
MDSARPALSWPPAVHAILWLDGVLVVGALLALAGMPPELAQLTSEDASTWTWLAFVGAGLTAVSAVLCAFGLGTPGRSHAWLLLPVPALVLWIIGSGMGCLEGAEASGADAAGAGRCLGFLLMISAPLLVLVLFMLWRAAARMPMRMLAMGALATAGAAASLLALVHPHDMSIVDLGAHAAALGIVLGVSAVAALVRARGDRSSAGLSAKVTTP